MNRRMCSEVSPLAVSSERASRTSPAQWSAMVDFFLDHPEMVTRTFSGLDARQKYNELWKELATSLNSMGYGAKTPDKWIDAFTKWKSKVKAKAQAIRLGLKKTGGGAPLPPLTPIEEKLMGILGWTIVVGDGTPELGLENVSMPSTLSSTPNIVQASKILTMPPLVPLTKSEATPVHVPPLVPVETTPVAVVQSPVLPHTSSQSTLEANFYDPDDQTMTDSVNPAPIDNRENVQKRTATTRNLAKKRKRVGTEVTLSSMHQETLSVLKEISKNIGRLADKQGCNCNCNCLK
ncbi:uncharacterized protein LOC115889711 isoform X2 [Sitophilus oryzae]|uniref:Regulatory protein zeste n=1 Tax=Sitophilus oryzae TaxID=7048 RepID=A0A6J2Y389_SITOR|nr:uncharacterized protein LOC115876999 isoform X2 [Sitophilus oryzae]XP_030757731.1 uncharacterized protein LOC115883502 isoform X2 [Sitophilus oryzae]XP_030757819.1 uncharacterized protein LOC115883604 isoform X2 [Sitophilus oryzae]XP_030765635.1 uncharacterized protein LOC115889711 isoform X2 [Sitophilus oryzae]